MSVLYFQCKRGHVFERSFTLAEINNGEHKAPYRCHLQYNNRRCNNSSIRIYMTPSEAKYKMGFEPTLLFRDSNGRVAFPAHNDISMLPPEYLDSMKRQGYNPVTIQTYGEYEKFLRDYRQRINDEADVLDEMRNQEWQPIREQARNDLINGFTYPIYDKQGNVTGTGKIPPLNEMHPTLRLYAERCLQVLDEPLEREDRPESYIDARENDRYSYKDHDEGSRWI